MGTSVRGESKGYNALTGQYRQRSYSLVIKVVKMGIFELFLQVFYAGKQKNNMMRINVENKFSISCHV